MSLPAWSPLASGTTTLASLAEPSCTAASHRADWLVVPAGERVLVARREGDRVSTALHRYEPTGCRVGDQLAGVTTSGQLLRAAIAPAGDESAIVLLVEDEARRVEVHGPGDARLVVATSHDPVAAFEVSDEGLAIRAAPPEDPRTFSWEAGAWRE